MSNLPILNYHGIESREGEYHWLAEEKPYVISFNKFSEHLDLIRSKGYSAGGLNQLDSWLDGHDVRKSVILTFDDGHLSHFHHVYPALKVRNMSGIFFIPVNLVGHQYHMGWDHLRKLVAEGFEIGSHGMSHKPLSDLTHHELWKEMHKSKSILEDKLGVKVTSFSVPRGFYQLRIREVALELGYRFVCTSRFDVNFPGQDRYRLNRIALKKIASIKDVDRFVSGRLGVKRTIEQLKETVRRFVKPSFYDSLAAWKRNLTHG